MSENSRTALVTGGGDGMGKATCIRLARDGMAVGVLDIDGNGAREVAEEIRRAGGRAEPVSADVSEAGQVEAAIGEIRKALGPVTVLVNNAGIEDFTPFEEIANDTWDRIMDVNLKGAYIVTRSVLPDMLRAGWGRIINIASLAAQNGAPRMVHYAASKGGIVAMTRSLAIELGPKGITANAIAPGFIDTAMSRRAAAGKQFVTLAEEMVKSYPIPRVGRPEEVAAACAFFASEEAGYITAQLLGVNGGTAV
jgi:NAD(P)-dependent dehydrogenase (short-subunit alcohol dehydrogenase family)